MQGWLRIQWGDYSSGLFILDDEAQKSCLYEVAPQSEEPVEVSKNTIPRTSKIQINMYALLKAKSRWFEYKKEVPAQVTEVFCPANRKTVYYARTLVTFYSVYRKSQFRKY